MRVKRLVAGIVAGAGLAAGGCGSDDAGPASGPATVVPPQVPFYMEASIRPEAGDAQALDSLSSKLAGVDDLGGLVIAELERSAAEDHTPFDYARDIEPWLGDRAGLFFGSFEGLGQTDQPEHFGFVAETTDESAANAFLDRVLSREPGAGKTTYEGVEYWKDSGDHMAAGVVGGEVIVGDDDSLPQVIDAASGESLADGDGYADALGSVGGEDQLATLYVDFGAVLDATVASGETDAADAAAAKAVLGGVLEQPIAAGARATPDSVTVDVSIPSDPAFAASGSDALAEAPADAWLAYGIGDLGDYADQAISQVAALGPELGEPGLSRDAISEAFRAQTGLDLEDDVLAWMGDSHAWVRGTTERDAEFGLTVATDDEEATTHALDAARDALSQDSSTVVGAPLSGGSAGFSAANRYGDGYVDVELADGQVDLIYAGDRAAADIPGDPTLASTPGFERARSLLPSDYEPLAYVAFTPLTDAIRASGEDVDPAGQRVLAAIDSVIAGIRTEDDRLVSQIAVSVP